MACIITYKNNKYSQQEFEKYFKNNFNEFVNEFLSQDIEGFQDFVNSQQNESSNVQSILNSNNINELAKQISEINQSNNVEDTNKSEDLSELQLFFNNLTEQEKLIINSKTSEEFENNFALRKSMDSTLTEEEYITELEECRLGKIKTKPNIKAEKGVSLSFTKNGKWSIVKELKGATHAEGGIDLTIGKDGVRMKGNGGDFYAKEGLVIPMLQIGGNLGNFNKQVSTQDSVGNRALNTVQFEKTMGSSTGHGLSNAGNPIFKNTNVPDKEAVDWYMNNIYPEVKDIYFSAMEQADAGDFLYNTGKDQRGYQIQEYLRKKNNFSKDWKWDGRNDIKQIENLWKEMQRLSENQRRIYGANGRDWFYKNRFRDKDNSGIAGVDYWSKTKNPDPNKQYYYDPSNGFYYERGEDGSLSPAYGKTWRYRVNNDKYTPFNKDFLINKVNKIR